MIMRKQRLWPNFLVMLPFKGLMFLALCGNTQSQQYNNPLAFYNTDILTYLQILHKNQQYENMLPFLSGPFLKGLSRAEAIEKLSDSSFGYSMKRAGIKEILRGEKWSLTYQRTVLGTQETFRIECEKILDTCRVIMSERDWKNIFNLGN